MGVRKAAERLGLIALALSVLFTAGSTGAQESRRGDRVLHRYLDPSRWVEEGGGGFSGSNRGAAQPVQGGGRGLSMTPGEEEWIWTADGPIGPETIDEPHGPLTLDGGASLLDERTDRVDEINYQASFQPSVVPFKRVAVQNRIRAVGSGSYVAYLQAESYERVDVGGRIGVGEERFRGSLLINLSPGERHGIPSIAPGQRILSVETEPEVEVRMERDAASNYSLLADYDGLLRLNMEIAVATEYFDGDPREIADWSAFDKPGEELEAQTMGVAREVLNRLAISRENLSPRQALMRLVEHYRDFEARPFEGRGDERDLFAALTMQQVGVCRHRSLAFLLAAQALGIRAHYVYNEAHAFVEVYWPGQGWRRIDLGGAADSFQYQNQQGASIHQGGREDVMPRPPAFEEELERLEAAAGGNSSDGVDEVAVEEEVETEALFSQRSAQQEVEAGGDEEPAAVPEVELLEADGEVLRGKPLRVRGRVIGATVGMRVEVFLMPVGEQERWQEGVKLGEATVDGGGYFEGAWEVPRRVGLGRWRLQGRVR